MENLTQGQNYEDRQFRMQCLELAARSGLEPTAEAIVAAAQKLYDFVGSAQRPLPPVKQVSGF